MSDMIRGIDYIHGHGNSCVFYEELASGAVARTIDHVSITYDNK